MRFIVVDLVTKNSLMRLFVYIVNSIVLFVVHIFLLDLNLNGFKWLFLYFRLSKLIFIVGYF